MLPGILYSENFMADRCEENMLEKKKHDALSCCLQWTISNDDVGRWRGASYFRRKVRPGTGF